MRAVAACLLFLVAASVVSAQSCTGLSAPSSDPLSTSAASTCGLAQTCQKNLCACTGSTSGFPGCLSASTLSCAATTQCYTTYFSCLMTTTAARQNTSDTGCSTFGNQVYIAMMAAITGTAFNTSALSQSCTYNACQLTNQTGNTGSCSSIVSSACSSANLLSGTPAPAPTTPQPTSRATDIVATLRISGNSWASVLNNSALYAQASTAIASDIAGYLGVSSSFIAIFSLNVGSLVVVFGVYQGSGKSPATLQATVQTAAASSTWLKSIASVYSTVSSEALTVQSVGIVSTAGPTTLAPGQTNVPTTPNKSSAVTAAGVSAVAIVAAALALFA